jgi:hypothetical protein
MRTDTPDRMNLRVWLMLAILGAVLAIVGWYRFFSA